MDTFTCPLCGMTSHNPNDAHEKWCGNCHGYTTVPAPPGMRWVILRGGYRIMGRMMTEPLPEEYHLIYNGEVYRREGTTYWCTGREPRESI